MITVEDNARREPGLANVRILDQTVRIRLRESGLRAMHPVVGPILKECHRTARLTWARARHRWKLHTWQHILSNEESRFPLRSSDWRYRVYRRLGERFTDQCGYESDRFGGGSVMVWAAWRTCARVELHHTSLYPMIDWFYASEMRNSRCCKRWSHTLLNFANLHTAWQFLSACPWFVLIMMLRNVVDIALFAFPYESKLYDLCPYVKILSIKPLYHFFCWLVYLTYVSTLIELCHYCT